MGAGMLGWGEGATGKIKEKGERLWRAVEHLALQERNCEDGGQRGQGPAETPAIGGPGRLLEAWLNGEA